MSSIPSAVPLRLSPTCTGCDHHCVLCCHDVAAMSSSPPVLRSGLPVHVYLCLSLQVSPWMPCPTTRLCTSIAWTWHTQQQCCWTRTTSSSTTGAQATSRSAPSVQQCLLPEPWCCSNCCQSHGAAGLLQTSCRGLIAATGLLQLPHWSLASSAARCARKAVGLCLIAIEQTCAPLDLLSACHLCALQRSALWLTVSSSDHTV